MTTSWFGRLTLALIAGVSFGCLDPNACVDDKGCFKGQRCIAQRCVTVDSGVQSGGAAGGVTAGGAAGGSAGGAVMSGGMAGGSAGGSTDGESCERPARLTAPMTVTETTAGARNDLSLRCAGFANPGPERVYAVAVPAGRRLVASVSPTELDAGLLFDPSLAIVAGPKENCGSSDAGVCLAGRDERGGDTAAWLNTGAFEEEVFIVVDSYLSEPDTNAGTTFQGAYELIVDLETPGAGDRCETAESISGAPIRTSTLDGYGPDYAFGRGGNCSFQAGPDRAFTLDVPAGQRLTATASPVPPDGGLDIVVNLVAAPPMNCSASPLTCLASADRGFRGDPDTATWVNPTSTVQTVLVVVGSYFSQLTDPTFTLSAVTQPLPPGDLCSTPIALTVGSTLTAQTLTGYGNDVEDGVRCASPGLVGTEADRFYSVTIPALQQLAVTVTPQAGLDTLLSIVDAASACVSPFECLAGDVSPQAPAGQVDRLVFTNRTSTPKEVLVLIDARAGTTGTFDLLATLSAAPQGEFCALATPLNLNQSVAGTTVGASNDYELGEGCASGITGPDTVYSITVPATQRASVMVTPTSGDGGFNPSLSLVPAPAASCEAEPRVCIGAANAAFGSAATRTATAFNGSSAPLSLFVIVDGASGGSGTFGLSATAVPPLTNDVCTSATLMLAVMPIATPQPLAGQTLGGFIRDYTCVASASGPDRVYAANIGSLEQLVVTVTPTPVQPDAGSFDPVVSVIDGPASACDSVRRSCLGAVDDGAQADGETLTVNNAGPGQTVFVTVGSYEETPRDSTFSIVATSRPLRDGDVCEKPISIPTTNTRTGDTLVELARDYDLVATTSAPDGGPGSGCRESTGADAVYALTVTNSLTVTVTPDAMSDVVVNLLDGPAASCRSATTCLAGADLGGDGGPELITFINTTGAPRTVFLVVSRYSAGAMTYSVAATLN